MQALPKHLQKYIVEQNYEKYTPVDQACWRFILRQLRSFLSQQAHESYVEGLEKTGIEIERIPKIQDISKKLEKFGWRALPVSGFIPPAAFMELQSLRVLPIASDMRTLEHLLYTPAPDIVHEAAGHAPILVNPEFANYLEEYAQVAKKAIISKEDLDLYEAIRDLSDIKEHPGSTSQEIAEAQKNLDLRAKNISHVSEAAELSRMNWWTAEYGLIGDLQHPKIFGAGLLSSVGESRWCLGNKVKKIPLTVDCINVGYDITEPQPQLFVTPDFETLTRVLHQMADKMAFRQGGLTGLKKAIQSKTVNTVELNTGLQISGIMTEVIVNKESSPIYIRTQGPTQICYKDKQLRGHDKNYHSSGFGTAIGFFKKFPTQCPSQMSDHQLQTLNLIPGKKVSFEFVDGVSISGTLDDIMKKDSQLLLMSFSDCQVQYMGRVLFEPSWGTYDMAVGSKVISVFAGPADREAYGQTEDFAAKRIPPRQFSSDEKLLYSHYGLLRVWRETKIQGPNLEKNLKELLQKHKQNFSKDWLLLVEALELVNDRLPQSQLKNELLQALQLLTESLPEQADTIRDGIQLAKSL